MLRVTENFLFFRITFAHVKERKQKPVENGVGVGISTNFCVYDHSNNCGMRKKLKMNIFEMNQIISSSPIGGIDSAKK